MKYFVYLLIPALMLASCGGNKAGKNDAELAKLKKERGTLDVKIHALEISTNDTSKKATPVSVLEVQPTVFNGYVEVQAQITGAQNTYASPQMGGIVNEILVHAGQHVTKGEVVATLDASAAKEQILEQEAQLDFAKTMYEKQQQLWAENIGTQVQLLQAKANYQSASKQHDALVAQRNMYNIVSPITGTIDQVTLKVGDMAGPGATGIRVVNTDKLKAEANLGENYLGKIQQGDPVIILLPDINDTIKTRLSYVAQAVDPISRAFVVQVQINNNNKLHPNMSCIMKIGNYKNNNAIVVPISVIQKTSKGDMLLIADGDVAKAVYVTTGVNSNGQVEILSGLNAGDKVITTGFEELDNGDPIAIQ